MAHCPKEKLNDLDSLLRKIAKLDGLKEKSKGTFYYKSKGFLHFHEKDGRRWADIRDGKDWGKPVDIDFNPSSAVANNFFIEVKCRYENTKSYK